MKRPIAVGTGQPAHRDRHVAAPLYLTHDGREGWARCVVRESQPHGVRHRRARRRIRSQPTGGPRDPPLPRPTDAHRPRHARVRSDAQTRGGDASGHHHRDQLQRRRTLGRDARRAAACLHPLARRPRRRCLMPTSSIVLAGRAGAPEVRLLDARSASVDEPGLRDWARTLRDAADACESARGRAQL